MVCHMSKVAQTSSRRRAVIALAVAGVLTIADIGVAAALHHRGSDRDDQRCTGLEVGGPFGERLRERGSNVAGDGVGRNGCVRGSAGSDGNRMMTPPGTDQNGSTPGGFGGRDRTGNGANGGPMLRPPMFNRPTTSTTTTTTTPQSSGT